MFKALVQDRPTVSGTGVAMGNASLATLLFSTSAVCLAALVIEDAQWAPRKVEKRDVPTLGLDDNRLPFSDPVARDQRSLSWQRIESIGCSE